MSTFTFIYRDKSLIINRDGALRLELKLNLTKGQVPNYTAIGDDLYKFHSGSEPDTVRSVTDDEINYLRKLNDLQYELVLKDPSAYATL